MDPQLTMHCEVRNDPVYIALREQGETKAMAYAVAAYHRLEWSELNRHCRLYVIKFHKPQPLLCPYCGSGHRLQLFNISGQYPDDDDDYDWCCRSCGSLKYYYKKEAGTSRRLLRKKRREALESALPGHLFGRFV